MANCLTLEKNKHTICGLSTQTYVVPTGGAGLYNVKAQVTEIPPSGLSIIVNNNGSPVYTAPTIGQTQSAIQFKTPALLLADADTITVVTTSSEASDNLLNSVQTNMSIGQGA